MRRKLAAVRSLFRFLVAHGVVEVNLAGFFERPKAPQTVPEFPPPNRPTS